MNGWIRSSLRPKKQESRPSQKKVKIVGPGTHHHPIINRFSTSTPAAGLYGIATGHAEVSPNSKPSAKTPMRTILPAMSESFP